MNRAKTDFDKTRALLDDVNTAIAGYDDVLKEKARDILLDVLFQEQSTEPAHEPGERRSSSSTSPPTAANTGNAPQRFAELLRCWSPHRASEKALLAAYHLRHHLGLETLTSQAINRVLKNHGLSVSNITRAIETNLRSSPPLIEQMAKRGETRQSRKEYVLTPAGTRLVEERLQIGCS
jgi:hypothetical protein